MTCQHGQPGQLGGQEKMIKRLVCIPQFFSSILRLNVSHVTCTFTLSTTVFFFFPFKVCFRDSGNFLNLKTEGHSISMAERVFPPEEWWGAAYTLCELFFHR